MPTHSQKKRAARRLAKEYALLQQSPVENCAASPLEDNIFEWHVNLTSANPEFEGVPFHFIMKFPSNYPDAAPKVVNKSYIDHPNVFGSYICLDILSMSEATLKTPYRGWTNAYTVSSVLIQLQSFLFEVSPNDANRKKMISSAKKYECKKCGHGKDGACFPAIGDLQMDNAIYSNVLQTHYSNGITLDDLQGRWVNSGGLIIIVKGETCTFVSKSGLSIKDVTIEFNGDDYMIDDWSLNRESTTIVWKKDDGRAVTAWNPCVETEFIVRNTNATPQPNDHVLVVAKLSKFNVGDILVVLKKDTDGDLKVIREGDVKKVGYVCAHELHKIQIIDNFDLQRNDRVKVIAPFHTNDQSKHELKVGDILIIKRRGTNGMAVNTENNSWKKNKWIFEKNFYKIKLAKAPKLRSGDMLRVVRQFDFNNRAHYSTDDFARVGDRLQVIKDTCIAPIIVQRFPTPWNSPRQLPACHMNKVVLVEESTAKKCPAKDPSGPTQGDKIRVIEALSAKYQKDVVDLEINDTFVITNVGKSGDIEVNTEESTWTHGKWIWQADFDKIEFISAPKRAIVSKPAEEILGLYYIDILPDHLFQAMLEFFNWEDLTRISLVAENIGHSMLKSKRIQMQSYRCFYTLLDATDADTILGFGVNCTRMNRRSRKTGDKKYCLQQLHVSFDIMSHEAFDKCAVRNNIWKDCEVDGFLPLFINLEHGQRAMALNRHLLPKLLKDGVEFSSDTVLKIYGKAMNTTVVDMMLSVKDVQTGQLQLIDSIKALEGFMALHHTLLAYALQYPQIVDQCTACVKKFIRDVQARDKEIVPDIGELLIALSLTNFTWAEFVLAWLEESMTRNARWILAKYPNLLTKETKVSCVRLNQSYTATRTGKRLAMFQRFFIERIASPLELEGNPEKLSILFQRYNERCGRPPLGLAEELQRHSRKVLACNDWFTYFDLVGFIAPSAENLWKWIHNAMAISERKRYHTKSNILHFKENHTVEPTDCTHKENHNCLCSGRIFKILPPSSTKLESTYVIEEKKNTDKLDVAFCVDTTGSMRPWIEAAKTQVSSTMQKIRKSGKNVRFGFVAYKDYSCPKSDVTTVSDFMRDETECQKIVNSWFTEGNRDVPEALAAGLGEVGNLTWDSEAQRICIVITDAPPHGIGGRYYDMYPEGHPNGGDVFKYAHTLGLAGVALYMVYTSRSSDVLTESIYRGLARRTGGAFLRLTNSSADQLSQIIQTSIVEEDVLDQLAKTVLPLYKQIKATHAIARQEQMVYQLHASAVAANITTNSCLMEEKLDEWQEGQIEDFVVCMDLAHCRAMTEHYDYVEFPDTKVPKEMSKRKRLITKEQTRKVLKRIEYLVEVEKLKKEGCRFRCPEWSDEAAATRWEEFAATQPEFVQVTLDQFAPWDKLTSTKLAEYGAIPDKELVRVKAIKMIDNYKSKKMKKTHLRVQSERPLIIRAGSGKMYDRVGTLAHGTVIIVQERSGSWIRHYKGWSKWSKGAFTRHTPANTKLFTSSSIAEWKPKPVAKPAAKPPTLISEPAAKPPTLISEPAAKPPTLISEPAAKPPTLISEPAKNPTPNEPSETIRVEGRIGWNSNINGIYYKQSTLHQGRVWYKKRFTHWHIRWCPKTRGWLIEDNFLNNTDICNASAEQDVIAPQFISVPWEVYDGDFIEDRNVKVKKVEMKNDLKKDTKEGPWSGSKSVTGTVEPPKVPSTRHSTPSKSVSTYTTPAPSESGSSTVSNNPLYNWRTYLGEQTMVEQKPQKYVTLQRCVVRADINPRSSKLQELPKDTEIQIDCVCKERARMIFPLKGWFWMSSPEGPLVRSLDFYSRTYDNPMDYVSELQVFSQLHRVTTIVPCVIRRTLKCQSAKLITLPVGTPLTVECVYKQRACVHANVNGDDVYGWCWLASPRGDLVELCPVKPTVVLTGSMVNDDDIQTTRNRLRFYGVQITNITRVDTMTVELEVSSHQNGIIAIKWIREVNGKKVKLAWKPSYLAYHKQSSSRV